LGIWDHARDMGLGGRLDDDKKKEGKGSNETENANWKKTEIVMTDGVRIKDMVHCRVNIVLRLLHLERQVYVICAHCLAQSKNALLWINAGGFVNAYITFIRKDNNEHLSDVKKIATN
jgi:hypothetical protein